MRKSSIHHQKLLRTVYRPIQPTVGDEPEAPLRYREFLPSDALKPYVSYYWVLWSDTGAHSPVMYRTVSDGCPDLVINCITFQRLWVVGASDGAITMEIPLPIKLFGIRFFPGCLPLFLPVPLKELVNKAASCIDVWGNRLHEFECRLFEAQSTRERIDLAETFLIQQLATNAFSPDHRFLEALDQIYHQRGHLLFERHASTSISPRQLRRLFDRYIGVNPKMFARIVRFQSVLHTMLRVPKQAWSDLYFDFGYYDQAHFIREFKHFFGTPPMSAHFPMMSGNYFLKNR
jgi:AraC-like DNA-binding protein